MNRQRTALTVLLAAIVVLLAMNLLTPGVTAQVPAAAGPAEAVLVDGEFDGDDLYRFFSDGRIDLLKVGWGFSCNPIESLQCPPFSGGPHEILPPSVPPGSPGPRVVAGRAQGGTRLLRFWSDGSVDVTTIQLAGDTNWCEPVAPSACPNNGPYQVIGAAPYAACSFYDGNFDGTINVLDLIELLLAFGMACP